MRQDERYRGEKVRSAEAVSLELHIGVHSPHTIAHDMTRNHCWKSNNSLELHVNHAITENM